MSINRIQFEIPQAIDAVLKYCTPYHQITPEYFTEDALEHLADNFERISFRLWEQSPLFKDLVKRRERVGRSTPKISKFDLKTHGITKADGKFLHCKDLWSLADAKGQMKVVPLSELWDTNKELQWGTDHTKSECFLSHVERALKSDLVYPMIVDPDLKIIDGKHRMIKAKLERRDTVVVCIVPKEVVDATV